MATIQITIDDTVRDDALIFLRKTRKNATLTLEDFLTERVKSFAKRERICCLDVNALIDGTGL